ncbi:type VII secretion integral membrane protein EccD [Nocardia sp. NPDC049220]|uniref:type VII secretion integral membrane protein EccD n=1 Tax=Nocardia sp. NPDC049220 TaxID=3155273 RepID=UPI0033E80104
MDSVLNGPGADETEVCRVSVIGGNTQLDMGLPTSVPVGVFIGEVAALIESRNPDLSEPEEGAPVVSRHWTLARLGHEPIPPDSTLTEAEVFDGELLVLRSVRTKEVPALFDDVIDAVARLTESAFGGWNASAARWAGLVVALVASVQALVLLVLSSFPLGAGAVALAGGTAACTAAVITARRYALTAVATGLSLCALVLLGPGVALLVPGRLGSPHALLACAVTLVVAAAAYRMTGVGATLFAAVATAVVFGGVAAGLIMAFDLDATKVAAGVLVAAVTFITPSAQLAGSAAKLPVPPVPTAGGAIDPADHEPRPTIEGIGAIGATALPSAAGLAERARVANQFQSGMIIGATLAAVAGAVVAADPLGSRPWQGVVLAVVAGLVLCLRGRFYADITQAGTLIGGGSLTLIALAAGLGLGSPSALIPAAAASLVLAAAAVFIGVAGPATDISPVTRRAGELLEYALIIAMIPLVVWTMDLYSAARNI